MQVRVLPVTLKPKQTNMKQFAFPLSVKYNGKNEREAIIEILDQLGYRGLDITDGLHIIVTNLNGKNGIYSNVWHTFRHDCDRHYIDHFNPELIRDIAAACTNDEWQDGEPLINLWHNEYQIAQGAVGSNYNFNITSWRRPTLAEICAHHGYEIKGRDIVKKVETVSNCDKSYCETARQLDEAKAEIKRLEERLSHVNQMSTCVEQVGNAMKLMKDLKEASQKTKIETLDHELARLRSENEELKELMRKRPTVFDSSSVSGGYLITFENKEDNCIEIAFCGKSKFEKVLKALHD